MGARLHVALAVALAVPGAAGLALAAALPAQAATVQSPRDPFQPLSAPVAPPSPTTTTPSSDPAPTPSGGGGSTHKVLRGESLWSITSDVLGGSASLEHLISGWKQLYTVNRPVVGSNPSHLVTGTVLRVPSDL